MSQSEIEITLPTPHPGQWAAYDLHAKKLALRCGRRWGKTDFLKMRVCEEVLIGHRVGFFTPDHKRASESFSEIISALAGLTVRADRSKGIYRASNGGQIDFWSLEKDGAGRSRKYHLVVVDEAAMTRPNMMDEWERSIAPTLWDFDGDAIIASTPAGIDEANFFWQICNNPDHGFTEHHAPTSDNPHMPADLMDREKAKNSPLVYQQEFEARFVSWHGVSFFAESDMLVGNRPVEYPKYCDYVFAIIDTAMKDTNDHDGTAISYYARSQHIGHPLVLLDWDILLIQGALLETWLPSVFTNLEALARKTGARRGSAGVWIEDKSSGTVLLQQAANKGWQAQAIDSALTALGKSARALSVSGYVFQQMLKISEPAYNKVVSFKGVTKNHWLSQVCGFRMGMKDGAADDLADTMTYALAVSLGNGEGF